MSLSLLNTFFFIPPYSFGNALDFDGVDDYVSMTNLGISSTATIAFWINLNSLDALILNDGILRSIAITAGANLQIKYNSALQGDFEWNSPITTGSWHHFVITRNGATMRAYMNGLEADKAGSTSPQTTDTSNLLVDEIGSSTTSRLEGKIDELVIWTAVASQANVTDLYNGGEGALASDVIIAPRRYYKFNSEGSSTTATDDGSDGEDGTLNNFPASGMWVSH